MPNSFDARSTLQVDGQTFHYYRLDALSRAGLDVSRLPFSLKILLENLLRHEDGVTVTADDIKALAAWDPKAEPDTRDRLPAQPRAAAGLHRRARRSSTWPPCATR